MRIRCHGDYHLGQVLFTGRDFMIIDFEGEPARSLGERRRQAHARCATSRACCARSTTPPSPRSSTPRTAAWWSRVDAAQRPGGTGAGAWCDAVSEAFLGATSRSPGDASWIPADREALRLLLDTSLLEKAVYELTYELNNRPTWVSVALMGIADLVGDGSAAQA